MMRRSGWRGVVLVEQSAEYLLALDDLQTRLRETETHLEHLAITRKTRHQPHRPDPRILSRSEIRFCLWPAASQL